MVFRTGISTVKNDITKEPRAVSAKQVTQVSSPHHNETKTEAKMQNQDSYLARCQVMEIQTFLAKDGVTSLVPAFATDNEAAIEFLSDLAEEFADQHLSYWHGEAYYQFKDWGAADAESEIAEPLRKLGVSIAVVEHCV